MFTLFYLHEGDDITYYMARINFWQNVHILLVSLYLYYGMFIIAKIPRTESSILPFRKTHKTNYIA